MVFNTKRYELSVVGGERFGREFAANGYVGLPEFLSPDGLELLDAEVARMASISRRRDFAMACMENSPRHMRTLGGRAIVETSSLLPLLYENALLRNFIEGVFGEPVALVDDLTERHVINILEGEGDTHGVHFDDFPIALVIFVKAPRPGTGGEVEFVAGAEALCEIDGPAARRERHRAGDAYVLKADTSAHRVAPLTADSSRIALNMAFARPGATTTTTVSASLLYD